MIQEGTGKTETLVNILEKAENPIPALVRSPKMRVDAMGPLTPAQRSLKDGGLTPPRQIQQSLCDLLQLVFSVSCPPLRLRSAAG